jgi:hypothetical protein
MAIESKLSASMGEAVMAERHVHITQASQQINKIKGEVK